MTHSLCSVLLLPLFPAPNFYPIERCDLLFQSNIWSAATDIEAGVLESSPLGTRVRLCRCLFSSVIKGRRALLAVGQKRVANLRHKPFKPRQCLLQHEGIKFKSCASPTRHRSMVKVCEGRARAAPRGCGGALGVCPALRAPRPPFPERSRSRCGRGEAARERLHCTLGEFRNKGGGL